MLPLTSQRVAMSLGVSLVLLILCFGIGLSSALPSTQYTEDAEADRVVHLPGWGDATGLFSGYVNVDEEAGRNLFYVYVESASTAPKDAPVLLWLNGGPGCSSLGGGFLSELGPFFPTSSGNLQANPHSWHKVAHVLFVESPAFVGFSYSLTPQDSIVGDKRTAQDMRRFLLKFMERYPHLQDKELYLSGESYAGHYIPGLAWEIVKGNRAAGTDESLAAGWLPLGGFAIGNPWTDTAMDNLGAVDFWWSHALISDQSALGIRANCNFTHIGPLDPHPDGSGEGTFTKEDMCDKFCTRAMNELGNINIYHIYADICTGPRAMRQAAALVHGLSQSQPPVQGKQGSLPSHMALGPQAALRTLSLPSDTANSNPTSYLGRSLLTQGSKESRKAVRGDAIMPSSYDPCVDDEVEVYLNRPEVQRALHANQTHIIKGRWTDCTRKIQYSRDDLLSSMLPIWRELLTAGADMGLRFMVYSGDVDGIVPVTGTRRWVSSLGLKERVAWRPWASLSVDGVQGPQVAGYAIDYDLPAPEHEAMQPMSGSKERNVEGGVTTSNLWVTRGSAYLPPPDETDLKTESTSTLRSSARGSGKSSRKVLYSKADKGGSGNKDSIKGGQESEGKAENQPQASSTKKGRGGSFVFTTVRGSGHMVPYAQPARALQLISSFLQGSEL